MDSRVPSDSVELKRFLKRLFLKGQRNISQEPLFTAADVSFDLNFAWSSKWPWIAPGNIFVKISRAQIWTTNRTVFWVQWTIFTEPIFFQTSRVVLNKKHLFNPIFSVSLLKITLEMVFFRIQHPIFSLKADIAVKIFNPGVGFLRIWKKINEIFKVRY